MKQDLLETSYILISDGVKGFDEQEELRIEDYLDQAPMSTYFSSAFEHTDHQRVLEVSRTKSRKVKIATKGKQLAETENWIIDELTGRVRYQPVTSISNPSFHHCHNFSATCTSD